MKHGIPDFGLVVLIGATGSGKSTFARKHFIESEIVSSDACRAIVSDDANNQAVSGDAFELVRFIAEKRLKHRKLTVIDATNVRSADRRMWIEVARRWHALPVAVVLDPGLDVCVARNKLRPDRQFGPQVPQRMIGEIRKGLRGLEKEGFRRVLVLRSVDEIEAADIVREPMWTDRRAEQGPFDIIGDVHGCGDELEILLGKLGYAIAWSETNGERTVKVTPPVGRKAVFVGDLVDRGPRTPDVLRIAMSMCAAGDALCVEGNHENKLTRWMNGRDVKIGHGLQQSIEQLEGETAQFKRDAREFLKDLRSHYWLASGKLCVAHAGLKEDLIGRGSGAVRSFALYGETTGEVDEFGLPVRADWAANYRGETAVVYGHVAQPEAEWVNNTICIDTGCVFGGKLTALRWPEQELVNTPALKTYFEPIRPLVSPKPAEPEDPARQLVDYADVSGRRWIDTALMKRIVIAEENAAAALEAMSRFAMAPQWLIYLPPTMSPVETSQREGWLERPEEAFAHYRERGVKEIVCEEKHMGSRGLLLICRDGEVAQRRFGTSGTESGAIWTRTGRNFFVDDAMRAGAIDRARNAIDEAGLWQELATDWLLIDAEIMPWSAKASGLIEGQYGPVAASAQAGLAAALEAARRASDRGLSGAVFTDRMAHRLERARKYATAWAPYVWPVAGIDDIRIAPFHILASEGAVHFDKPHAWHMGLAHSLAGAGAPVMHATTWRSLALDDEHACADAIAWWEELTLRGGEGMVVKPADFIARGEKALLQPALKVRGSEYLRIIYGPEYDAPEHLARLRSRGLGGKRALALREFALGHEALLRFVNRQPLRRVHECVFGVLGLESEPIDPRL
jgi:protein phosphatase